MTVKEEPNITYNDAHSVQFPGPLLDRQQRTDGSDAAVKYLHYWLMILGI